MQALHHARCAFGLYAIDLYLGVERLHGKGDARDQSAAAHRHHDGLNVGQLVEQLQTDGSLARNDVLVVEGMNEGVAVLVAQLQCFLVGIVVDARHEAHLGTQPLCCLHLADGCALGQADERFYAHGRSAERHALRVVSG